MKRKAVMVMLLSACTAAMLGLGANAAETDLTPGVTVEADENSATGYTATFVYENADAENVDIVAGFAFYNDDGVTRGHVPEEFATPEEWEDGMFPAEVNRYVAPLEKVDGTDYWTLSVPLPSGHYQYYYTVDGSDEVVFDPANMPMQSTAENGGTYEASTLDVPWDAEKQANTTDYSFAMQRTDEKQGTLNFVNYTDVDGATQALAVYLPYGYDAERAEAYPTLYVSHGGGGNEVHWFAGTNLHYIFDNLIAEGKVEPTVIVGMNNTVYSEQVEQGFSWNFEKIVKNVTDCIIPYVEENYNVSKEVDDRAFAGQSMGGMTTSNVLYREPDKFRYFCIMSGADGSYDFSKVDADLLNQDKIFIGAGIYDFGLTNRDTPDSRVNFSLEEYTLPKLDELGIKYDFETVNGAHDWYIWQQLIRDFAVDHLWK